MSICTEVLWFIPYRAVLNALCSDCQLYINLILFPVFSELVLRLSDLFATLFAILFLNYLPVSVFMLFADDLGYFNKCLHMDSTQPATDNSLQNTLLPKDPAEHAYLQMGVAHQEVMICTYPASADNPPSPYRTRMQWIHEYGTPGEIWWLRGSLWGILWQCENFFEY